MNCSASVFVMSRAPIIFSIQTVVNIAIMLAVVYLTVSYNRAT